jgi:hypothetical protein
MHLEYENHNICAHSCRLPSQHQKERMVIWRAHQTRSRTVYPLVFVKQNHCYVTDWPHFTYILSRDRFISNKFLNNNSILNIVLQHSDVTCRCALAHFISLRAA